MSQINEMKLNILQKELEATQKSYDSHQKIFYSFPVFFVSIIGLIEQIKFSDANKELAYIFILAVAIAMLLIVISELTKYHGYRSYLETEINYLLNPFKTMEDKRFNPILKWSIFSNHIGDNPTYISARFWAFYSSFVLIVMLVSFLLYKPIPAPFVICFCFMGFVARGMYSIHKTDNFFLSTIGIKKNKDWLIKTALSVFIIGFLIFGFTYIKFYTPKIVLPKDTFTYKNDNVITAEFTSIKPIQTVSLIFADGTPTIPLRWYVISNKAYIIVDLTSSFITTGKYYIRIQLINDEVVSKDFFYVFDSDDVDKNRYFKKYINQLNEIRPLDIDKTNYEKLTNELQQAYINGDYQKVNELKEQVKFFNAKVEPILNKIEREPFIHAEIMGRKRLYN
jgi:hypothetical protein